MIILSTGRACSVLQFTKFKRFSCFYEINKAKNAFQEKLRIQNMFPRTINTSTAPAGVYFYRLPEVRFLARSATDSMTELKKYSFSKRFFSQGQDFVKVVC